MAAAVEEPVENVRAKLAALKTRRDELETELLNLYSQLRKHNVTMTEPLVDGEGYPRSDIDVYTIRHIRHEIICKQNDCQALTEEMRLGLYALHLEEKKNINAVDPSLKPFAWVDQIDENSPAQKADLRVGDHIVKFGNLSEKNFTDLNSLKLFVDSNLRKPISVYVLRNEGLCPLVLIPDEWSGNGYLGCRIKLLNTPESMVSTAQ